MNLEKLQACILAAFKSTNQNAATERAGPKLKAILRSSMENEGCHKNAVFCELMSHPGKRTGDVGGCGDGPDDFSQSKDREHEMRILLSQEMKDFYTRNDIKLVSFKDLEITV